MRARAGSGSPETPFPGPRANSAGGGPAPAVAAAGTAAVALARAEPGSEAPGSEEDAANDLPAVEDLVKQLRPEVVAALEELFRAQWTGVKRLRADDLKSP
jgi:hypothetical protein